MDVTLAFLHNELREEIYILQPKGIIQPRWETMVYHLFKSLYGLKQAPSFIWYENFDFHLTQIGYIK
jgi:hypothetical protein